MSKKQRFIDGIHNYCDRWCERCPLTAYCRVYADEQADQDDDPKSRDINNEAFWNKLHNVFQKTLAMVKEMAQERGVDLNNLEEAARAERQIERRARQDPLYRSAYAYAMKVHRWFLKNDRLFQRKGKELARHLRMELPGHDPEAEGLAIAEAVEVVRWYEFFIAAKLNRAASKEEEVDPEFAAMDAYDANGSAKIALIALDRSIAAWSQLLGAFPRKERQILDFLVRLTRLRSETEQAYPDARSFIRPGFDTVVK